MHVVTVMGTVFILIALGELPDKTMFATLVLATRGRPLAVWAGAASAFLVHVCLAVVAGGLLALLPHAVVAGIAAALFLGGAVYVLREGEADNAEEAVGVVDTIGRHRMFITSFLVIFLAEWGDLTQILVANFAARYAAPVQVGIAAVLALWAVAAFAIVASRYLQRLPMTAVRRVSATIMLALAIWSALSAAGVV
ncbi:MAG: TMEM165/GDT1 family protein [Acidothermaceae bacterium]